MDFWKILIGYITQGGEPAVIAILIGLIILLIWDRKLVLAALAKSQDQLLESQDKVVEAKEQEIESIKEIVEKYHNGTLTTIQALNEIKVVLASIQGSIR